MAIEVRIDEPLPARADPARMRQVIGNLYDNAVKYGDRGMTITVSGEVVDSQPPRVSLSVHNQGPSIPPEELGRIWNRLYRGAGAGDRRDGLGLGLALVRAIVTAHGGSVEVDSGIGRGTRFTIELPAESQAPIITKV